MKKTYTAPRTEVVKIQLSGIIAASPDITPISISEVTGVDNLFIGGDTEGIITEAQSKDDGDDKWNELW